MANGVYRILCIKNNAIYIGEAQNTSKRLTKHRYFLKNNIHYSKLLQSSWNEYGKEYFVFDIIEKDQEFKREDRIKREEYWINFYKNDGMFKVCNIRHGDIYISEEGKKNCAKKMSERMSGEKHPMWGKEGYWNGKQRPEEFKQKVSNSLKGHTVSDEARKKMAEAKKGKDPHNKFPITPELLEDIKNGISYKDFEAKYGKSKNTLKRIKQELAGKPPRIRKDR